MSDMVAAELIPSVDEQIPEFLKYLEIPGLCDIHVHFMPESMLQKVWAYFDQAEQSYGRPWPITYRLDEPARIARLRSFGVQAIPALSYAHKPGMSTWLNAWAQDFASRVPGALHCATFYPEPGVASYVSEAIEAGAQLFKLHIQVGAFAPDDVRLDEAWQVLEKSQTPVVIHAGSAPLEGRFTGPELLRRVLEKFPELVLVIAHMGMPEYHQFADLAEEFSGVYLDTTMVGTDFTNEFAPMPQSYVDRLLQLQDKIILGTDYPNIPYQYAHQIQALARLGHGKAWLRAVLWENGTRLLGLPAKAAR